MNVQTAKRHRCPVCRSADLVSATFRREFRPRGKVVTVTLLTSRCPSCGTESTTAAQHQENLVRLSARKSEYDGLLLGEQISALRRRYGLTQQLAAKLFGKGKIAFSRYENEASYPDDSTTKLLKLAIRKPDVIKLLADDAGIALPLWEVRCDDERGGKLRMIFEGAPDRLAQRWAKARLASGSNRTALEGLSWPLVDCNGGEVTDNRSANDGHYHLVEATYG